MVTGLETDDLLTEEAPAAVRQSARNVFLEAFLSGWEPEPEISVSRWAEEHRILSSDDSAMPGRWRNDLTPYLVEIMDRLSPHNPAKRVVFIGGSQVGKTTAALNWIGCCMHLAPGPILMVLPDKDTAKAVSAQRVAPMIQDCAVLRDRVGSARARDAGNTTLRKKFTGGILMLVGANKATGLKSRPIRYLYCDEVDEYHADVEGQGDPVKLAEARLKTYSRIAKTLLTSTPTVRGFSRIESEYFRSDRRRFYVPCPACGHMDWIRWENIRWEPGQPETARLRCAECQALIEEHEKPAMMLAGAWRPTSESQSGTFGYQLSSLYSPPGWYSWVDAARGWIDSEGRPFERKTFINNILAETWEERGDVPDAEALEARRERYVAQVPNGVGLLTCQVDVHKDRLEVQVDGWGRGEESWVIEWTAFRGDPNEVTVWQTLDSYLRQQFECQSGRRMRISCTVIDSGYLPDPVYRFCAARPRRGIYAIKGDKNTPGRPIVGRPSLHNRYKIPLFLIGLDAAKETAMSRLRIKSPGPGYRHFPEELDSEYFEQLLAEHPLREFRKGVGIVRTWVTTRERNEAWDLTVYGIAALYLLGPAMIRSLGDRAEQFAKPPEAGPEPEAPGQVTAAAKARRGRGRTNWVTGRRS
jgi:phage terminase large subunit GpA-like protein